MIPDANAVVTGRTAYAIGNSDQLSKNPVLQPAYQHTNLFDSLSNPIYLGRALVIPVCLPSVPIKN